MTAKTRYAQSSHIPMQAVPAVPGHFVISPVCDIDKPHLINDYCLDEVLAWALDRDSLQPYPITLDGLDDNTPSILRPNGKIHRLGMESYDSISQWMADLNRRMGNKV